MVGWSFRVRIFCAALMFVSVVVALPPSASTAQTPLGCAIPATQTTDATNMTVTDLWPDLWIRSGPSGDCDAIVEKVPAGATVTRTATTATGDWSHVRSAAGNTGWVESTRLAAGSGAGGTPASNNAPVIIFDTDMGPDVDDAVALAMLHGYANRGLANIAAVTLSRNSDWGVKYISLLNTYYGRGQIPIGAFKGSTGKDADQANWFSRSLVASSQHPFNQSINMSSVPAGHEVMRGVLEQSPPNSVVIVQVGFSTNTAELLRRHPDLVREKAPTLSIMAGQSGNPNHSDFNTKFAVEDARKVWTDWPHKIIQSEDSVGRNLLYPYEEITGRLGTEHPIRQSYEAADLPQHSDNPPFYDMRTWDLTSVMEAVEPNAYLPVDRRGWVTLDTGARNTVFRSDSSGRHHVLQRFLSDSENRRTVARMVDLVSSAPGSNPTPPAGGGSGSTTGQFQVIDSPEGYTTLGVRSSAERTTPNEANVIAWLTTGDIITRQSISGSWSQVTTQSGVTGWVETARIQTTDQNTGSTSNQFRVAGLYDLLGVRSSPEQTDPNELNVETWVPKGDIVTRLGVVGDWSEVVAPNGVRGWVQTGFLEPVAGDGSGVGAPGEYRVNISPEGYTTLGVRSSAVRTTPNEANVIAWLTSGDTVTVNNTQGEWSNVTTTDGTTGWVETARLNGSGSGSDGGSDGGSGGGTSTTGQFQVNTSPEGYTTLGLRSEPVRTAPNEANVIAWLISGDLVNRTQTQGDWSYVIAANGSEGWTETSRLNSTGGGSDSSGGSGSGDGGGSGTGDGSVIPPLNDDGTPIVIFDTDMGPDIDDALALAMLHEYANQGKAQIAAVTLSRNSDTGARYNDAVNTFYCRPNIPVGVYRGSTSKDTSEQGFTADIVGRYPYNLNMSTVQEGHLVMRDVLRAAPDNSVVIIQVGFSTNTARLLEEYPDLVAQKARLLSVMGGENNTGSPRFNISNAPYAAHKVFADWPTTLIQSEFRLGYDIHYPLSSINNDFNYQPNHIIKDSYLAPNYPDEMEWHPARGSHYDMRSWDLTSVIAAIEDPSDYFSPLRRGRISVDPGQGTTSFSEGSGDHYVLGLARDMDDPQQQRIIDRMTELTSARPHCGGGTPPPATPDNCRIDGSYPADLLRRVTTNAPLYQDAGEPYSDPACRTHSIGTIPAGEIVQVIESSTGYFRIRNGGWIRQSMTETSPAGSEPTTPTVQPPWCPEGLRYGGLFDEYVEDFDGWVQPFVFERPRQQLMVLQSTTAVNAACADMTDIRGGTIVVPVTVAANSIGIDYGGERLYIPEGSYEFISTAPAAAIGYCAGGSGGVFVGGGLSGCYWVDENGLAAENKNGNVGFHSPGAGVQAGPVWATGISSLNDIGGVSTCIDVAGGLLVGAGTFMCASLSSQARVHGAASGLDLDRLVRLDDSGRFGVSGSVTLGIGSVSIKSGDRAQEIRDKVCGEHREFTDDNKLHRFCPTTDGTTGSGSGEYPEGVLT